MRYIYLFFLFSFFVGCKKIEPIKEHIYTNKDIDFSSDYDAFKKYIFDEINAIRDSFNAPTIINPVVVSGNTGNNRTGNPDVDALICPLDNPDSDGDRVCDSKDRCPGFDDSIDNDRDGSPHGCDCEDDNPRVLPGFACSDDGLETVCFSDICDPNLSGQCITMPDAAGSVCQGALQGKCDEINTCDGAGICIDNKKPDDFVCRKQAGACDIEETCDGVNNDCPTNQFAPAGSSCGRDNLGTCDGNARCDRAHECPGSSNPTDNDGDNWTIDCDCNDNDAAVFPGRPCDADTQECTEDICDPDLSGQCLHIKEQVGRACGNAPTDTCDAQDTCNVEGSCVDNVKPFPYVCRIAMGFCDKTEVCNGVSKECPAEGYKPSGTICGDAVSGSCDVADTCNGLGSCIYNVAPNTTICRPSQDACDINELCDGVTTQCPANAYAMSGVACGPAPSLPCDLQDTCNGSGVCLALVAPINTSCRAAANTCDIGEVCDGVSQSCPSNLFAPNGDSMQVCNNTGYSAVGCSTGSIFCDDGLEICYPSSIACTQSIIYGQSDDLLGAAVDVQATQSILGAYGTHGDSFNADNQGSCYMAFENSAYPPVNWSRGSQIFPSGDPDEIKRGEFGRAVGVSGNNAIVGAPRTDHKDKLINTQATGRVYFYSKDTNNNWNLNNFFDDPEVGGVETTGALFGFSVDIDGAWALAGGPGERTQLGNLAQGGVSLFFLDPLTKTWSKIEDLLPDANGPINATNLFGYAVGISGDWAIISAPGQSGLVGSESGAVVFYFNDPQTGWTETQTILQPLPNSTAITGFYGKSVDISGDLAIVSGFGLDVNSKTGAAVIYRLVGNTWQEEQILETNATNFGGDFFAESVAINNNIAVVGAPAASVNGGAYVFIYDGISWQFKEILINDSLDNGSSSNAQIGQAVAVESDTILVGAPSAQLTNDEGAVLLYHYPQ